MWRVLTWMFTFTSPCAGGRFGTGPEPDAVMLPPAAALPAPRGTSVRGAATWQQSWGRSCPLCILMVVHILDYLTTDFIVLHMSLYSFKMWVSVDILCIWLVLRQYVSFHTCCWERGLFFCVYCHLNFCTMEDIFTKLDSPSRKHKDFIWFSQTLCVVIISLRSAWVFHNRAALRSTQLAVNHLTPRGKDFTRK